VLLRIYSLTPVVYRYRGGFWICLWGRTSVWSAVSRPLGRVVLHWLTEVYY